MEEAKKMEWVEVLEDPDKIRELLKDVEYEEDSVDYKISLLEARKRLLESVVSSLGTQTISLEAFHRIFPTEMAKYGTAEYKTGALEAKIYE